jgi:hypothetical protein
MGGERNSRGHKPEKERELLSPIGDVSFEAKHRDDAVAGAKRTLGAALAARRTP